MPRLSDTMEEGRIGRWLKREGDSFREGDIIAEIETDKATMEFQAYDDGTVLRIIVDDGETAALGAPIAIVGEAGEKVEEPAKATGRSPQPETPVPDANVSPRRRPRRRATARPRCCASARSRGAWPTQQDSTCGRWPGREAAPTAAS